MPYCFAIFPSESGIAILEALEKQRLYINVDIHKIPLDSLIEYPIIVS